MPRAKRKATKRMVLLHPALVHFPIALLIVSVVLDATGVLLRQAGLTQAGFATLILGGLGAGVAALTGPDEDAKDALARDVLIRHELFAVLTVIVSLILIGVRIGNPQGLRGSVAFGYLAGGIVLIVAVGITGYFGGELTYAHGVGVAQLQGAPAPGEPNGVLSMWAKIGGLALLAVIVGYGISIARQTRRPGQEAAAARWTLSA